MRTKKYLYNSISSILLYIVILVCGLIIPKLIIATYGSAINGLISSITQFLGYITIAQAGVGAVSRAALYKPLAEKDITSISTIVFSTEVFFRKVAFIFLIYMLLLIFIYPLSINEEFSWCFIASLLVTIAFSIFSEYFFGMSYALLLQSDQMLYVTNIVQILLYALNTIVIYILISTGSSILFVKIISAIIFCIRPLFIRVYVKRKYHILPADTVKKIELNQKWDAFGQHIAYYLYSNTGIVILTLFAPLKEVSVYAVYNSLINIIQRLIVESTVGLEAIYGEMLAKGEVDSVEKTLRKFELLMATILSIVLTTAMIMFVPFINLYLKGITDANYIRYSLAAAMICTVFVYCIRLPYAWIVTAAGHFLQTQKAAYLEVTINIVLSLIFMHFIGTVGIVIGMAIAGLLRTIYFAFYVSAKILKRNIWLFINRSLTTLINIAIILLINYYILPQADIESYQEWCTHAIFIFCIATLITVLMNFIAYKESMMEFLRFLKTKLLFD